MQEHRKLVALSENQLVTCYTAIIPAVENTTEMLICDKSHLHYNLIISIELKFTCEKIEFYVIVT
jgi:hypothetical protein